MVKLLLLLSVALTGHQALAFRSYLTPIGQFCPHRSDALVTYTELLGNMQTSLQKFETAKKRGLRSMEDLENTTKLRLVARRLDAFLLAHSHLVQFRQQSGDYQLKELLAEPNAQNLQQVQLEANSVPLCQELTKRIDQVIYRNENSEHYDGDDESDDSSAALQALWELLQDQSSLTVDPLLNADMPFTEISISATPFHETVYLSTPQQVQLEYLHLLNDHKIHIEEGAEFGNMPKYEKLQYLDDLRAIEERWDVLFFRFNLMEALNPLYQKQCSSWLAGLGFDPDHYQEIHEGCLGSLTRQDNFEDLPDYFRDLLALDPFNNNENEQMKD